MNCFNKEDLSSMPREEIVSALSTAISRWYVRRDSKFYDIDHLSAKLSKDDVQRACLHRFSEELPGLDLTDPAVLKAAFYRAIDQKHTIPGQSIPVWDGSIVCNPGDPSRLVSRRGAYRHNSRLPTSRRAASSR